MAWDKDLFIIPAGTKIVTEDREVILKEATVGQVRDHEWGTVRVAGVGEGSMRDSATNRRIEPPSSKVPGWM